MAFAKSNSACIHHILGATAKSATHDAVADAQRSPSRRRIDADATKPRRYRTARAHDGVGGEVNGASVKLTVVTESGVETLATTWRGAHELLENVYAEETETIITATAGSARSVIFRSALGELQLIATEGNREFVPVLPRPWPVDAVRFAEHWCGGGTLE